MTVVEPISIPSLCMTSGEDYSGDWGERHDDELTGEAQQTSGEPDAQPQAIDPADLPLDAEGYPVE